MRRRLLAAAIIGFALGFLIRPSAGGSSVDGTIRVPTGASSAHLASPTATIPQAPPVPVPPTTSPEQTTCEPGSIAAPSTGYDQWPLTVLDTRHQLAAGYVPPDLVDASAANFDVGFLVRGVLLDPLRTLDRAASADGVRLVITSAYRSYKQQAATFDALVARLGSQAASRRAALPGHSEHQLGTAIDFAREGGGYEWLAANASAYGFVASYARGASCYEFEPWHYRYVGIDLAARVEASGLSLHDFLLRLDR